MERLSYASGRPITVVGKPSSAFFEAALRRLGIVAEHAAMIGDDIDSDIAACPGSGHPERPGQNGKVQGELRESVGRQA